MSNSGAININSENLVNYSTASTSISNGAYDLGVIKPDSFSNLIKDNIIVVYSIGETDKDRISPEKE